MVNKLVFKPFIVDLSSREDYSPEGIKPIVELEFTRAFDGTKAVRNVIARKAIRKNRGSHAIGMAIESSMAILNEAPFYGAHYFAHEIPEDILGEDSKPLSPRDDLYSDRQHQVLLEMLISEHTGDPSNLSLGRRNELHLRALKYIRVYRANNRMPGKERPKDGQLDFGFS